MSGDVHTFEVFPRMSFKRICQKYICIFNQRSFFVFVFLSIHWIQVVYFQQPEQCIVTN